MERQGVVQTIIAVVLGIAIVVLAWVLFRSLTTPINFKNEVDKRETAVINRIKDIRTAQQAYRQKYQRYTPSFDSLITFILEDSLTFTRLSGSADDTVAVARGLVKNEEFTIAVKDTLFKTQTMAQIMELPLIPYGNGAEYIMDAGTFQTESKVVVPVFEAKAPYKAYLWDIAENDKQIRQELINYIDDAKILGRYPGIKVGSMEQATNDAGNWE